MAAGWVIGVLVEVPGERAPVRHFFAVGHEDRARCEWAAVDEAMLAGTVASSPSRGIEPVSAVGEVPPPLAAKLGLRNREVRALGAKWPRRWVGVPRTPEDAR